MGASPPQSYPPIADYGLIGNCHTAALISSRGSIDWLCMPRFDSPALFARILDLEQGGAWSIQPAAHYHAHNQYLDEANVLETIYTCDQGRVRLLDFMALGSGHSSDMLVPGILMRVVEGIDGEVDILSHCTPRPNYAREQPQFELSENTVRFDQFILSGPSAWQLDTSTNAVCCQQRIRAGARIAFTLGQQRDADRQPADPLAALDSTVAFWRSYVGRCSYRGPYRSAVVRSVLALKLLIDAPTGAIVAAPTTSLPEAIGGVRNWDYRFTWIRDASFTLYALLLAGYIDEDNPFFSWIERTVDLERSGLQVLHPISPDGDTTEHILDHLAGYRGSRPVRIGNAAANQIQLDIYGEVLDALHFAWQAGGYDPRGVWDHFQPIVDWVAAHWDQPEQGIWEDPRRPAKFCVWQGDDMGCA